MKELFFFFAGVANQKKNLDIHNNKNFAYYTSFEPEFNAPISNNFY